MRTAVSTLEGSVSALAVMVAAYIVSPATVPGAPPPPAALAPPATEARRRNILRYTASVLAITLTSQGSTAPPDLGSLERQGVLRKEEVVLLARSSAPVPVLCHWMSCHLVEAGATGQAVQVHCVGWGQILGCFCMAC